MKKAFYLSLMMFLFVLISGIIYLSVLVVLVRNDIILLQDIVRITDILMSSKAYFIVGLIGAIGWYLFGLRWWQIIYVDGVYYFDQSKKRDTRRRTIKKAPKE
jgi:hypothetical protein